MHHQEGGVVRGDVTQRRRVPTPVRVFPDRATHQPAFGRIRRVVIDLAGEIVHPEKVGRSTKIDHRRHATVQFRVWPQRTLQLFHPTGDAQHCHQVAASRVAVDGDPFGIHPESFRIGFQPANRRLAVVNLCGPPRLAAEPVSDCDSDVPSSRHEPRHPAQSVPLVAVLPTTTVDIGQHRQPLVRRTSNGKKNVQPVSGVLVADIIHVIDPLDALGQPATTREKRDMFRQGDGAIPIRINPAEILPCRLGQFRLHEPSVLVSIPLPKKFLGRRIGRTNQQQRQERATPSRIPTHYFASRRGSTSQRCRTK